VTRVLILVQNLPVPSGSGPASPAWRTRRIWSSGAADTSASKRYHCCWLDAHMNMLPGRASERVTGGGEQDRKPNTDREHAQRTARLLSLPPQAEYMGGIEMRLVPRGEEHGIER
jgi:hypothetical protein